MRYRSQIQVLHCNKIVPVRNPFFIYSSSLEMTEVGEVLPKELAVEWRIPDFFSISEEPDVCLCSPSFDFAGASWYLEIYPSGCTEDNSVGFIDIYLVKQSHHPPISLKFSLGLKSSDGKKHQTHHAYVFKRAKGYGTYFYLSRSELLERKSELTPSDVLTVCCSLKYRESTEDEGVTEECSYCEETLDAESISSHEKKCTERPIKCPECSDVVILRDWYDHECQKETAKIDASLCRNYKKMLMDGRKHDLILKIGDKELKAHQDILRARSRVFESILNHEMTEKDKGIIDLPDCDSQAMEQFLFYVYCGKIENLDQKNMLGLYYIADKYEIEGLKEECCEFIKESLTHTNVCEVIQFAMKHSDSVLECATEYFTDNTVDVMMTVEWQSFLKDNSTLGNELLLKSFKKLAK